MASSPGTTNRNVSLTATDAAGNANPPTLDSTNASVDAQAPVRTLHSFPTRRSSDLGGAFKLGDTVTATWNNTAAGDNNLDIAGVTVNFTQFGGGAADVATNSA